MGKDLVIPWADAEEGVIVRDKDVWFVRIGTLVNKPKRVKKYEDSCVSLSMYAGEGSSVLGYSFAPKKKFHHSLEQPYYVSLLSDTTHKNPKLVFKDQKVHLYRFNSTKDPSYWFLYRGRPENAR